jgi:hypothetical protein
MSKTMVRLFRLLTVVAAITCASSLWTPVGHAQATGPLNERERQLMGIAASCVAFYQAAMAELELPIEGNEAKRQSFLQVFDTLAKRGRSRKEYEASFQRDVVMRTIEVTTIIDNDPQTARPQVLGNLPKCDAYLDEMKTVAGLS